MEFIGKQVNDWRRQSEHTAIMYARMYTTQSKDSMNAQIA